MAPAVRKPTKGKRRNRNTTAIATRKIGRPTGYDPAKHPGLAAKYALLGLTEVEIATQLKISDKTLDNWKARDPAFLRAIESGQLEADAEVASSLYLRAKGGIKMPAVKIFYDKDKGEPVYAPYLETLAPDVNAARLWLLNRQPGRWKERREVDMTITLEQQIAQLTPEERKARLIELQAKAAGTLIEGEATEVEDGEDRGV